MKMQLGLKTEIFFSKNDHLKASFVGGFISICMRKEVFFCCCCFVSNLRSSVCSHVGLLFSTLPVKSRKRLACDISVTLL